MAEDTPTFKWFRYDTGSYGTTSESTPPEGATFVEDLDEFNSEDADKFTLENLPTVADVIAMANTGSSDDDDDNGGGGGSGSGGGGGENTALLQLPQTTKIVKVGDEIRAVLEFSDGLGAAWYDLTDVQFNNLGSPAAEESYANASQFQAKYGDFYFGNVNEIEVNGDVAWQQMTKSIFAEFGAFIPLDTPELKRLVLQGYLEGWDSTQVEAAYKNTSYYNNMSNAARDWAGMSDAEKELAIERQAYSLLSHYVFENGEYPDDGLKHFTDQAKQIASGQTTAEAIKYSMTTEAQGVVGSPAEQRLSDQLSAKNAAIGQDNANYSRILNSHNVYYGNHVAVDEGHYRELARQLSTNEIDWNSVMNTIQTGSAATHVGKDPTLTWNQYSSGAKSILKEGLELNSVENNDPLLIKVLGGELQGKDIDLAIRADDRFLKTKRAENEFTDSVNSIGSMLGFE